MYLHFSSSIQGTSFLRDPSYYKGNICPSFLFFLFISFDFAFLLVSFFFLLFFLLLLKRFEEPLISLWTLFWFWVSPHPFGVPSSTLANSITSYSLNSWVWISWRNLLGIKKIILTFTIDFNSNNLHLIKNSYHTYHMISNKNPFYHLNVHNSPKSNLSSQLALITKHLLHTKNNII